MGFGVLEGPYEDGSEERGRPYGGGREGVGKGSGKARESVLVADLRM